MSTSPSAKLSINGSLENNIANLINSTKVFLKALTRWTKKLETQKSISNHYVTLGNDFQVVVKQFTAISIDMTNMRNVPRELRQILEKALKEEPSNESLDKYWPSIKEIIEYLLNTIKMKRIELKKLQQSQATSKDLDHGIVTPERESAENETQVYQQHEGTGSKNSLNSGSLDSLKFAESESMSPQKDDLGVESEDKEVSKEQPVEVDKASEATAESSSATAEHSEVKIEQPTTSTPSNKTVKASENTSLPSIGTPSKSKLDPESELKKKKLSKFLSMSGFGDDDDEEEEYFDDFPEDEQADDDSEGEANFGLSNSKMVMSELKKETKIERRASKRYSAYHLTKHNTLTDSQTSLPMTNNSISAEPVFDSVSITPPSSLLSSNLSNNIAQKRNGSDGTNGYGDKLSAILKNKVSNNYQQPTSDLKSPSKSLFNSDSNQESRAVNKTPNAVTVTTHDKVESTSYTKQPSFITIFLKYEGNTVRVETTFPLKTSLESLFAEKFSVMNNDLDRFCLIDPKYPGVSYNVINEKEELPNVTDGFLIELIARKPDLSKNQDSLRIDHNNVMMEKLEKSIENSQSALLHKLEKMIQARQLTTKDDIKNSNVEPLHFEADHSNDVKRIQDENKILRKEVIKMDALKKEEIAKLEKKLAQTLSQIDLLKKSQSTQTQKNDDSAEIADLKFITKTSTKISSDGDSILNRVDDLQDVIEILRKDVAVRGVKPKASNLEAIKKELGSTQITLSSFEAFIKDNKPELKVKWESQLVSICDQQQMLSLQEDLILDLQSDLEKCKETLDLVILCSEERSRKNQGENSKKQVILPLVKPGELNGVRDQLLQDIELLEPDHQSRIQAIEKHEKFNGINK